MESASIQNGGAESNSLAADKTDAILKKSRSADKHSSSAEQGSNNGAGEDHPMAETREGAAATTEKPSVSLPVIPLQKAVSLPEMRENESQPDSKPAEVEPASATVVAPGASGSKEAAGSEGCADEGTAGKLEATTTKNDTNASEAALNQSLRSERDETLTRGALPAAETSLAEPPAVVEDKAGAAQPPSSVEKQEAPAAESLKQ